LSVCCANNSLEAVSWPKSPTSLVRGNIGGEAELGAGQEADQNLPERRRATQQVARRDSGHAEPVEPGEVDQHPDLQERCHPV